MNRDGWNKKNTFYIIGVLCALIFLAYSPVLTSDFINYDDPSYVTSNPHVSSGISLSSIGWAFSTFHSYNWHPVTWISHMVDVQFFGLNPVWHHITSLILHIANSVLLFILFKKMTGDHWKSLCVAGLFALHPLHVESVAWVAERKDVLSTFFWFLAMLTYVKFIRNPKAAPYLLSVLLFIFGLMAKPMVITLPFVLLLMDYWPLGRWHPNGLNALPKSGGPSGRSLSGLVLEKVPLVFLSVASILITYMAQKKGGALPVDSYLVDNISHALINYLRYALKMVWPGGLAAFYPYPPVATSLWMMVLGIISILIISILMIRVVKRFPYLTMGWLWYLITFVPVIGFLKIGQHAMADRYTYIPFIGLFIMVVWGIEDFAKQFHADRKILAIAMIAILIVYAGLTNLQARKWQNSVTLFSHAIRVTEDNWLAHKNLAAALAQQGDLVEALRHASESLRIKPDALEYVSQGWLYLSLGNYEKAVEACKNSIAMSPNNDRAHFILGVSYIHLKDDRSAMAEYTFLRNMNSPYASRLLGFINRGGMIPTKP